MPECASSGVKRKREERVAGAEQSPAGWPSQVLARNVSSGAFRRWELLRFCVGQEPVFGVELLVSTEALYHRGGWGGVFVSMQGAATDSLDTLAEGKCAIFPS